MFKEHIRGGQTVGGWLAGITRDKRWRPEEAVKKAAEPARNAGIPGAICVVRELPIFRVSIPATEAQDGEPSFLT